MIILTGASGGIGQEIFHSLIALDDVIGLYNKTTPPTDVYFAWGHKGSRCYKIDITNKEEIKLFIDVIKPKEITLIHLAALKVDNLALNVTEEEWDKVVAVNLKGAFFLTQALIPKMMEEKWGRIIWITSSGIGDIGTITYSLTKSALMSLSKVFSKEYARYGITSNVLKLGYFETGLWLQLTKEKQEELLKQIPSKKLGHPQNIVNVIKMIIDSDYINGSEVKIDGGIK